MKKIFGLFILISLVLACSKWVPFVTKDESLKVLADLFGEAFFPLFIHSLVSVLVALEILIKKRRTLPHMTLIESRLLPFVVFEMLMLGKSVMDIRDYADKTDPIYYGACLVVVYLIAFGLGFLVSYVEKKEIPFPKENVEAIAEE